MEFVIKQSVLKDELGFVQGIVEKKSTIPVLSNILIESVGENTIRIVGTDLDVTIRCEAEADIKQSGAMCIQARKLFDIVRLLENGDVHFTKEENDWVKMTCGKSKFRLAGVSKDNFPEVPSFKSAPMKLPTEIFNHFIQHTAFAITNEQSRFTLSGAKFIVADGMAKMVTTDGHRLAYIERNLGENAPAETMDTLIPKKALMELVKISRDANSEVSFGEDPNHIYFEVDGRLLITRKLSGNLPNYEMVIPKDNDKVATFDLEEMKSAIRRVALMADERTRSVKLNIKSGEIEIGAQSSEEGEANESVAADYDGEEVQVGFNSQYLQEFLSVVTAKEAESVTENESDGEKVKVKETSNRQRIAFEFKNGNAQTMMNIAGDTNYNYKYIVMPLRI